MNITTFDDKWIPEPNSGCWLWLAALDGKGYGAVGDKNKVRRAHVVSYELRVGSVPVGLELDHKCRNTACVNPDHLEPVTHAENMRRAAMFRTHCKNGHPFIGDNLQIRSRGERVCKTCNNRWTRESKARRKVTF